MIGDLFLPQSEKDKIVEIHNEHEKHLQDVIDPQESWKIIVDHYNEQHNIQNNEFNNSIIGVLVDTHGHAHLDKESQTNYQLTNNNNYDDTNDDAIVSLTCAVEQADWVSCLEYVSKSHHRIAAIGIHPWYLNNLNDDKWLHELEILIINHPGCMIGEIGLCKMARFIRTYEYGKQAALELQRNVFIQQIKIAAKYKRPVSIHCVDQHNILLDIFKKLDPTCELPPVIGLHSFSGTAHQVQQLLKWEDDLFNTSKDQNSSKKMKTITPKIILPESFEQPIIYFGFSHSINYAMCSSDKSRIRGRDAIRIVPRNRLLSESDVQRHIDLPAGTAGSVAYIAWALDESIIDVASLTRNNGLAFLSSLSKNSCDSALGLDDKEG